MKNKWVRATNDIMKLERKYDPHTLYSSAISCMIVALVRNCRRSEVPDYISAIVNRELKSFDRVVSKKKTPSHWKE